MITRAFLPLVFVACSSSFSGVPSTIETAGEGGAPSTIETAGEGGAPSTIETAGGAPSTIETAGEGGAPSTIETAGEGGAPSAVEPAGEGGAPSPDAGPICTDECVLGERQCGLQNRAEVCSTVDGCARWIELIPAAICMSF